MSAPTINATPTPTPTMPDINKLGARQLRSHISQMLRGEFNLRLEELARLLEAACRRLEVVERSPPRTDFLNVRVLIGDKQSQYNKPNAQETLAIIWNTLGLDTVREVAAPGPDGAPINPDDAHYVTDANGQPIFALSVFDVAAYPEKVTKMVNTIFPGVQRFECNLTVVHDHKHSDDLARSRKIAWLHARATVAEAIRIVEEKRLEVLELVERDSPKFAEVISRGLKTEADNDSEEEGSEPDDDDDDHPTKRARIDPNESGQHIDTESVQLRPAKGLKNLRTREFKATDKIFKAHQLDACSAMILQSMTPLMKRLPNPSAPAFNYGAEIRHDRLVVPGEDVNKDTIVTEAMRDHFPGLDETYLKLHCEVKELRQRIGRCAVVFKQLFDFEVLKIYDDCTKVVKLPQLTYAEQYALGLLYLQNISRETSPEGEEGEGEEEEGEEEGSEHDPDSDFDQEDDNDSDEEEDDSDEDSDEESDEDSDEYEEQEDADASDEEESDSE